MMSPGAYLAKRRQAAGLSIDDVAAMVHTAPHLRHFDRSAWIGRIEHDVAAITPDVERALRGAYRFDRRLLHRLIDLRSYGEGAVEVPRLCQICGCSGHDPCIDPATGETCAWDGDDLCTSCIGKDLPHAA